VEWVVLGSDLVRHHFLTGDNLGYHILVMTTPFKALQPFEPRIVDLLYEATPMPCFDCTDCSDATDITDNNIIIACPAILTQPVSTPNNISPLSFTVALDLPGFGETYQWQYFYRGGWVNLADGGVPALSGTATANLGITFGPGDQPLWEIRVVITIPGCPTLTSNTVLTWT
jgi:hypothetical protein